MELVGTFDEFKATCGLLQPGLKAIYSMDHTEPPTITRVILLDKQSGQLGFTWYDQNTVPSEAVFTAYLASVIVPVIKVTTNG